ncbi:hypothetical protein [Ferrimonas marina]|uniref:hypothetical protein n=1 Tax=Ferrimonas marina TaxID=299255 RepID=UPI000A759FB4|nr:hypothetical protein [Ferrimonas marina]
MYRARSPRYLAACFALWIGLLGQGLVLSAMHEGEHQFALLTTELAEFSAAYEQHQQGDCLADVLLEHCVASLTNWVSAMAAVPVPSLPLLSYHHQLLLGLRLTGTIRGPPALLQLG